MAYSLQVFCAVYDYRFVTDEEAPGTVVVAYGDAFAEPTKVRTVTVPQRYWERPAAEASPRMEKFKYAGEDFYLAFGVDERTNNPDWLGEIFEWLSSSYELSIQHRDAIGRVSYESTVFGTQNIPFRVPHCALLMAWLEKVFREDEGGEDLISARLFPPPGVKHAVVCSHDVDYYYVNKRDALVRLFKNMVLAARPYRNWSFFKTSAGLLLKAAFGARVGDFLPRMLDSMEKLGIRSTIFVVSRRNHRRDPNYDLPHVSGNLRDARLRGFGVGLHGSYTSIIENRELKPESVELEAAIGHKVTGGRQHWLRFGRHASLHAAIEKAHLRFDSTLGFSENVGFRNGANFAFPPYDFENERPCEFLEIPLVLMDGGLEAEARRTATTPQVLADEILEQCRKWGWGGIALLWHNPMEPLSVPEEINQVFWNTANQRSTFDESWMSGEEFMQLALPRYQNAGLLRNVRSDA